MPILEPPEVLLSLESERVCRNWEADRDGTDQRQINLGVVVAAQGNAVNYLLAWQRRVIARFIRHKDFVPADGVTPTYVYTFADYFDNGKDRRFRALVGYPAAGTGDAFVQRTSASSGTVDAASISGKTPLPAAAFSHARDLVELQFDYDREADIGPGQTDGDDDEGIAIFPTAATNSLKVYDVSVQEKPVEDLDTTASTGHLYVDVAGVLSGRKCLDDAMESIRDAFHKLRTENMPIVACWSANKLAAGWESSATTDLTVGYYSATSANYENIHNRAVTSRSATSPGHLYNAYRCGIGLETAEAGKQVKCQVRVFADATVATGTVRFDGSATFASNQADISVTTAGPAWFGSSTDFVYLDSSKKITDTTTARNKIDVLDKAGASGTIRIYAYMIWIGEA